VTRDRTIALAASGGVLIALTALALLIQWQDNLFRFLAVTAAQSAAYLVAVWTAWSGPSSRRVVLWIAAVAILLRIPILYLPPYLSTDVYRYIWDGRVEAAGINPYRYLPADPHLEALRDPDIFPRINRANTAVTIYPPIAEAIFLAVTRISESVTAMKAAMVGFEIITFVMLVHMLATEGLPISRVLVYAWHPLPLWEFAGSGHIDAALIAFTVVALWAAQRRRSAVAGFFIAGATLVKFYPAVLLPALYRRWNWSMPAGFAAIVILAYLFFIAVGSRVIGFLPGYAAEEGFDASGSGLYLLALMRHLPPFADLSAGVYMIGAALILATLGVAIIFGRNSARSPFAPAMALAAVFMVLVSPHYAWYFAWLIVFACFVRALAFLWLTNACLLLYLIPVGSHIVRDDYRLAVESAIYVPFAALSVADLWYHRHSAIGSS
jgi:hypothetical protein